MGVDCSGPRLTCLFSSSFLVFFFSVFCFFYVFLFFLFFFFSVFFFFVFFVFSFTGFLKSLAIWEASHSFWESGGKRSVEADMRTST